MVGCVSKRSGHESPSGRAWQRAGDIDKASEAYSQILKIRPDSPEVLSYHASTCVAQGNFADAIKDLRQQSSVRPDAGLVLKIAALQMATKDRDGAKATLEEGMKVYKDSQRLMQMLAGLLASNNDINGALAILHKGQTEVAPKSPAWWIQEADIVKDPASRSAAIQKAWELNPNNPQTLVHLMDAQVEAKQYQDLIQLAQKLKSPPPVVAVVMQSCLGRAYLETGDQALGMEWLRKAFLTCQGEEVSEAESRVRKALGDERYVSTLRSWISQQDCWALRLALARQLKLSKETQPQAMELLENCDLSNASGLVKMIVYHDKALLFTTMQRFAEARTAYEATLNIKGVNAPSLRGTALNNLAFLLADNLNEPKEAISNARQAMQLLPQDPGVIDTLAWTYYRAKQLDLAERHLENAIELDPAAAFRYHLGMVKEARGNKDEAIKQYRIAYEILRDDRDNEYLLKVKERLAALGAI